MTAAPTIYVDEMQKTPAYHGPSKAQARRAGARHGHQWSHLWSADQQALHAFAQRLGMKRGWCDGDHYDLAGPEWRARAIAAGAVEITRREMSSRVVRQRVDARFAEFEAAGGELDGQPHPFLLERARQEIETGQTPPEIAERAERFPRTVERARFHAKLDAARAKATRMAETMGVTR